MEKENSVMSRIFERSFACFHRVNHVFFNCSDLIRTEFSIQRINFCRADHRSFPFGKNLNTLRRRIRALIKLSRKIFHCKHSIRIIIKSISYVIELRLGENSMYRIVK